MEFEKKGKTHGKIMEFPGIVLVRPPADLSVLKLVIVLACRPWKNDARVMENHG